MRKAVRLRALTTEEETEIRKSAAPRKAAYRLVQRANVIVAMLDDPKLHATQAGQLAGFSQVEAQALPFSSSITWHLGER